MTINIQEVINIGGAIIGGGAVLAGFNWFVITQVFKAERPKIIKEINGTYKRSKECELIVKGQEIVIMEFSEEISKINEKLDRLYQHLIGGKND